MSERSKRGPSGPAVTAESPMGRLATADDLVGAVLLLAGPAGGFITGQTLVVDGGFSLG